MIRFLRRESLAPLWTIIRIWLGWQWLTAGWHKINDPAWIKSGVALKGFWANAVSASVIHYGWYKSFIQGMLKTNQYTWFGKLVAYGEFLVGIALIIGIATVFALVIGAFLNLNYMLAGSTSTNPILYTLSFILLIAGFAAYKYGVDYLYVKYFKRVGL